MFRVKKSLPTWCQNVDLGQRKLFDLNWVFIILLVLFSFFIIFLGIYFFPESKNDYRVFQRVEELFNHL